MIRKFLLTVLMGTLVIPAMGAEVKQLPTPNKTGGMPVMEAINMRQSGRDYNPQHKVDDQTLSEILWVAWGMNDYGKRTIPTSRNKQNMELYLLTEDGTWRYEAADNALVKVNDKNLIPLCVKQDFVPNAPVHLLYAAKNDGTGPLHVGSAYQNVYLYATSKGMQTVIRRMINVDALNKEMGFGEDRSVIAHQTIGYAE